MQVQFLLSALIPWRNTVVVILVPCVIPLVFAGLKGFETSNGMRTIALSPAFGSIVNAKTKTATFAQIDQIRSTNKPHVN